MEIDKKKKKTVTFVSFSDDTTKMIKWCRIGYQDTNYSNIYHAKSPKVTDARSGIFPLLFGPLTTIMLFLVYSYFTSCILGSNMNCYRITYTFLDHKEMFGYVPKTLMSKWFAKNDTNIRQNGNIKIIFLTAWTICTRFSSPGRDHWIWLHMQENIVTSWQATRVLWMSQVTIKVNVRVLFQWFYTHTGLVTIETPSPRISHTWEFVFFFLLS